MTQDSDAHAELEAVFDWLRTICDGRPDVAKLISELLRKLAESLNYLLARKADLPGYITAIPEHSDARRAAEAAYRRRLGEPVDLPPWGG